MANSIGLGKGLDALFGSDVDFEDLESLSDEPFAGASNDPRNSEDDNQTVQMVDIYEIEPDENQPRHNFDSDKLEELSESIRSFGLLQPLLVQRVNDHYRIIAGERRYRAARLAGLKEVPVIIRDFDAQDVMAVALIENLQRQDLNPIEEARGYQRLMDEFDMTQEAIAVKLGKKRASIANILRYQNLPEPVQNSLAEGLISAGHAKVLLSLKDPSEISQLALQCISEGWSVRDLEDVIAQNASSKKRSVKSKPEKVPVRSLSQRLAEDRLKELLRTKVSVSKGVRKGKIEIEYYSDDDLDRIVSMFEIASENGSAEGEKV